ncbi:MAG TPA: hypothetical protein VNC82_23435 [Candidatus Limnocylindria bacterium]|nr:hypothetical protein [Candidatus Limnocylindria bacterium]
MRVLLLLLTAAPATAFAQGSFAALARSSLAPIEGRVVLAGARRARPGPRPAPAAQGDDLAGHPARPELAAVIRWLIDTGPLVAYVDGSDPAHDAVSTVLDEFPGALRDL